MRAACFYALVILLLLATPAVAQAAGGVGGTPDG